MQIATFKAKCKKSSCGHDFDVPLLSDFTYGEFIYSSIDGKEFRYYNSLDCETWNFIDKTVSEYLGKKNREEIGTIIQKIIGLVADRQNPDIYFTQDIHCPKCHSKVESVNDNNKTGLKEFEILTFNNFTKLIESEKRKLIFRLSSEFFF